MAWFHEVIVQFGSSFLESRLKAVWSVADAMDNDGGEHAAIEFQVVSRSAPVLEGDERPETTPYQRAQFLGSTSLNNLEYLNLASSGITDEGLKHLKNLKNLHSLYLWRTLVTKVGVAKLQKRLPKCKIETHALQAR